MPSDPIATRDSGLRRASRITRGALAGGLILAGALSALAARELPGRASPPAGRMAQSRRGSSLLPPSESGAVPGLLPPSGAGAGSALQPPVSAPTSGSGGGPAVSGGS